MSSNETSSRRGKTFEQRFLDELSRQCNGEDISISNEILREQLGWQDERFDKVRKSLIDKKVIKAAPGRGGKTKFVSFDQEKPKKKSLGAFISYSHIDEEMKDSFLQHLKPLERLGIIENWHDRMIKPGDNFNSVISEEIDGADIIFILISVDFINSRYCYEIELGRAIERHNAGTARIIPIILRNCLWVHSPFGGIQALPRDGKAVSSFPDRDDALSEIAEEVLDLAKEILSKSE